MTRRDELELLGGARFERGDCRARARGEIRHVDGSTVGKARRWRTGFSARHSVTVAVGFSLRQSPVERERERERERAGILSRFPLESWESLSLSTSVDALFEEYAVSQQTSVCWGPSHRALSINPIRSDPIDRESPLVAMMIIRSSPGSEHCAAAALCERVAAGVTDAARRGGARQTAGPPPLRSPQALRRSSRRERARATPGLRRRPTPRASPRSLDKRRTRSSVSSRRSNIRDPGSYSLSLSLEILTKRDLLCLFLAKTQESTDVDESAGSPQFMASVRTALLSKPRPNKNELIAWTSRLGGGEPSLRHLAKPLERVT